jgi:Homocysteine/selenocysteine methylase (S-methylmethionine-dependent)
VSPAAISGTASAIALPIVAAAGRMPLSPTPVNPPVMIGLGVAVVDGPVVLDRDLAGVEFDSHRGTVRRVGVGDCGRVERHRLLEHRRPYPRQVAFPDPAGSLMVSDGGLASALEARGHELSDALWSARLLLDQPAEVVAVHRAFFRAGAVIATTASYQASFEGFAARGVGRAATKLLLRRSVELVRVARAELAGDGRPRWVAASVGPYGAMLADGSEYRGRYGRSVAQLTAWHRARLEVLVGARPDVLALETVPDADEGEALMAAVAGLGVPAWLSYSIAGNRTRAGQPMAEAFAVATAVPEVVAVGVNCCAPGDVAAAVATARAVTGKPVVVYPNSGEGWDPIRRAWVGPSRFSARQAARWVAGGARILGGCCRVRPADIAELARVVSDAG